MSEVRHTVRQAATWRLVAELMRRHGRRLDLHVCELHPADGAYDCVSLFAGPFQRRLCDFNLAAQHIHAYRGDGRGGPRRVAFPRVADDDYVQALLAEPDPKNVVDVVEPGGSTGYWRDDNGVHHVPKRRLTDIIVAEY